MAKKSRQTSRLADAAREAESCLILAEKAERGDTRAAYDLACLIKPGSIAELLELVAPEGPTTRAFDAVADGFALAQLVNQGRSHEQA